jgi:hypothetical protein
MAHPQTSETHQSKASDPADPADPADLIDANVSCKRASLLFVASLASFIGASLFLATL